MSTFFWVLQLLFVILCSCELGYCFTTVKMSTAPKSLNAITKTKHTLYDIPISNNGARCRIILYKKQLPETEFSISSPMDIGGLKGEDFRQLNSQQKVPTLVITETGQSIPESDTICRYLMSKYGSVGPSFLPNDAKSNLIARMHDVYLSPIQGCMYKSSPPYGTYGTRGDALKEFKRQIGIINDLIDNERGGLYLLGKDISLADATLFPTMVFAHHMLPKFGIAQSEALPQKIKVWYDGVIKNDTVFAIVHDELSGALQKWDAGGRWDAVLLAGLRDESPPTIFDKIVAGDIPATIVRSDDKVTAFKDINPAAPAHIIVIPKDRNNLSRITKASLEHVEVLGQLMVTAADIARDKSLGFGDGARIVVNDGPDGGQEVPHLHLHVLGGREMAWPPG